jgi:hypothetical protein
MLVIYGTKLESRLLFASSAARSEGIPARIFIRTLQDRETDSDEQDCLKWINLSPSQSIEQISDSELGSLEGDACLVSIRGNFGEDERTHIRNLISGFTRRIGLLRFSGNSRVWQTKQVIRELRNPFYSLFSELWTEDSHIRLIRAFLRKPHRFYGALPHQRCSVLPDAWNLLESNRLLGERPCLFCSAGTANPFRDKFARWVETKLVQDGSAIQLLPNDEIHRIIWHYDRSGSTRERSYEAYIHDLDSAWFSLCLPGFTGTTNRVLESILRGSVPIIQEELVPFHRLPLLDGVNAIFVKGGQWVVAIHQISQINNLNRLIMQRNVFKLVESSASLSAISKRLLRELLGEG